MARTVAGLPAGSRITDYISLGVLAKTFPLDKVMAVVAAAGKTNQRQRDLPAHVVVYLESVRSRRRCASHASRWRRPAWSGPRGRENPYGRVCHPEIAGTLRYREAHLDK